MSLDALKYEVALGSRILSFTGLAAGVRASMGHVSLRDPTIPIASSSRVAVTRSTCCRGCGPSTWWCAISTAI